jgi:hypothetical protein
MVNLIKRFVIVGTAVLAMAAPSVAFARLNLNAPPAPAASHQVQAPVVSATQATTASSPQGFRWDDAAIGAAGVLVMASVGLGAVLVRRRHTQQPATS